MSQVSSSSAHANARLGLLAADPAVTQTAAVAQAKSQAVAQAAALGAKSTAAVVPSAAATGKASKPAKSWFKRWFGQDDEFVSADEMQAEVLIAQAPTDSAGAVVSDAGPVPQAVPAAPASASAASGGVKMPDLMNDMVGGMPLGAMLTSGGMFAYGLIGKGNANVSTGDSNDSRAPVLLSATTTGDGKKIILTYDEALNTTVPASTSFVVKVDGVAVTLATTGAVARGTDTKTLELTLPTALAGLQTVQVSYTQPAAFMFNGVDASSSIKDAAGNRAMGFTDQAVAVVDTTSPTFSSSKLYTSADASVVVLTYSEALLTTAAPLPSAFTVTNSDGTANPVTAVTVTGKEVRLTLTNKLTTATGVYVAYTAPTADGVKTNAAVQDITGNDASSITTAVFVANVADSTAATFSSASVNAAGTQITITLSEALDALKTASVDAFAVQITEGSTIRPLAISAVSVQGSQVILTLTERLQNGTGGIQVSYFDPTDNVNDSQALQDLAGNDVLSFLAQTVANNVDITAPVVTQTSLKDSKTLVLTYAEDLATVTAAAQAFVVTSAGTANAVTAVKVNGKTLELTLTNVVAPGDAVSWGYTAPTADIAATNAAVQDVVGNDMVTVSNQTLDTARPTLTSTVTNTSGNIITMTFNEPLLSTSLPAASLFQVRGNTSGSHTVSSLSVSGNVLTLNLAVPVLSAEAVTMVYNGAADTIGTANTALQDLAGNDYATTGTLPVQISNKVSPLLTSEAMGANASAGTFNQVVLTFDDTLNATATLPAVSDFTVKLGTTTQTVSSVQVSGNNVILNFASSLSVTSAAALTVGYTPGTNGLKDLDGNVVASFADKSVAILGTVGSESISGTATGEYFYGQQGNDTMTGAGGVDTFVMPTVITSLQQNTIKDFGLKQATTGALQGSAEADVLDLKSLLVGYSATSTPSQFIQITTNSSGKLVMNIDKDGSSGTSNPFTTAASVVFDNIHLVTGSTTGALEVSTTINGSTYNSTTYTTANILDRLIADQQLILSL